MLHLAFRTYSDLETASSGEGLRRYVVAYPKGYEHVDSPPRESRFSDRRR
jgi:spoIIIJ-associated protein